MGNFEGIASASLLDLDQSSHVQQLDFELELELNSAY